MPTSENTPTLEAKGPAEQVEGQEAAYQPSVAGSLAARYLVVLAS